MRDLNEDPSLLYMKSLVAKENSVQKDCKESMLSTGKAGMSVSAIEASLLRFFVRTNSFKTIVEIGTFAGYSGLWMAEALPEDGVFHGFEYSEEHYKMAISHFEKANLKCKWEIHLGDAKEKLKEISGPFDMVFIDANKAAYVEYLDWAIANTKKNSWIIGDNTLLFGELGKENPDRVSKSQWQGMRDFNKKLCDESLFESCFIPSLEGMTIGVRK